MRILKTVCLSLLAFLISTASAANWHTATYVWSFGFALEADVVLSNPNNFEQYENDDLKHLKNGDLVWINGENLYEFFFMDFHKIKEPFFLIIGGSDLTFPDDYKKQFPIDSLIQSENVLHIFAQNNALSRMHPKVSSIPIGMDYHTLLLRPNTFYGTFQTIAEQDNYLSLLTTLPLSFQEKCPLILSDFHHRNTSHGRPWEDRAQIANILQQSHVASFIEKPLPRPELWMEKTTYQFSASPHGRGLDCHRTWEDLILGCIVIVKTSPLDCLYEGLPVVIVKDWHEVSEEMLKTWGDVYKDLIEAGSYKNQLTHSYWIAKIKTLQMYYRSGGKLQSFGGL